MKLLRRLRALFRKDALDREMSEEMRHHLELQVEENIAAGMNLKEARYQAQRQFGGIEQVKEQARDARRWIWVEQLLQDLGYAGRMLRKNPGFTTVAVLTLGLGIGANIAIFTLVNGVTLRPLPYAQADRIVRLRETLPEGKGENDVSALNYLDWEKQATVFDRLACISGPRRAILMGADESLSVMVRSVSAQHFDVFNNGTALGRTFVSGEDQPGNDQVVVLGHAFWKSAFGADPKVIGRTVSIDGRPFTVIGVLSGGAWDRTEDQIYQPLVFSPVQRVRGSHWFTVNARLKPGVSRAQAQAEMDIIAARLAHDYPESNQGWGIKVEFFNGARVWPNLSQSLYLLMAAAGMVLLLACATLANLTLARGVVREREVAIRASLGAGRWRLVRQLLTESLLLSTLGSLFGLGLGWISLHGLKLILPLIGFPSEADISMDGPVLGFALVLAILTGVFCGLAPALQSTRPGLIAAMKQAGSGLSGGGRRQRLRNLLVCIQVTLAFVLLTGAGLLLRSFSQLQSVDMRVIDPGKVIWAMLPIPAKKFPTPELFLGYFQQMADRLRALPGVSNVAMTQGASRSFQIAGRAPIDKANRPTCGFQMATPSYSRTFGSRLIKGRLLNERDIKGTLPVALINETMARKYFPDEDPIGKRILIPDLPFGEKNLGPEIAWEVVGVIVDARIGPPRMNDEKPTVYVTMEQSPQTYNVMVLFVRSAIDPALLEPAIRRAVHESNPEQALLSVGTVEQVRLRHLGNNWFFLVLLEIFAGVALLLAAIGIYGVVSYSVTQRTQEIGIRAALGANSRNIMGLILRSGMAPVVLGLAVGLAGVLGLTRLLSSLLYGVGEHDPLTIAAVGVILALVALIACFLPARRAAKVDPMVALRHE